MEVFPRQILKPGILAIEVNWYNDRVTQRSVFAFHDCCAIYSAKFIDNARLSVSTKM